MAFLFCCNRRYFSEHCIKTWLQQLRTIDWVEISYKYLSVSIAELSTWSLSLSMTTSSTLYLLNKSRVSATISYVDVSQSLNQLTISHSSQQPYDSLKRSLINSDIFFLRKKWFMPSITLLDTGLVCQRILSPYFLSSLRYFLLRGGRVIAPYECMLGTERYIGVDCFVESSNEKATIEEEEGAFRPRRGVETT